MKKIILLAAMFCFAALNVNAQEEESESKVEKMLRLTKAADETPTDWKAQMEAGRFLLNKEQGMYNMSQAEKYFERVYHVATDYNKEIPDSVLRETCMMLMTMASNKKNIDKALFYIDEMIHAEKVGAEMGNGPMCYVLAWGIMYGMVKGDLVKSLSYMMDFRERLIKDNTPGIEYTDAFTAMTFERMIEKYRNLFSDKVVELVLDGKKYYVISIGDWNIEKPLMGWLQNTKENPLLLYGEDGKVCDEVHGNMEYSFGYFKDGVKPSDKANAQLVTVTPEMRQQMVEAYRNYMKKAKKNKK